MGTAGMMDTTCPGDGGYRMAQGSAYSMAGKAGTAQVISRKGAAAVDLRSLSLHLWHRSTFEEFAPAESPRIATVMAVESRGYGGSTAAPIARRVFDAHILLPKPAPEHGKQRRGDVLRP